MRLVDDTGAAWPITGYRCTRCRLPLDPVLAATDTHPSCDPGPVLPADAHARLVAALTRALGAHSIDHEEIA